MADDQEVSLRASMGFSIVHLILHKQASIYFLSKYSEFKHLTPYFVIRLISSGFYKRVPLTLLF